jgi:hypothetical protein
MIHTHIFGDIIGGGGIRTQAIMVAALCVIVLAAVVQGAVV